MLKKILVGGFLLVMIGAVIAGAVTVFAQQESADECTGSSDLPKDTIARQGAGRQGAGRQSADSQGTGNQTGQGTDQGRGQEAQESDAPQNNYGKGQELSRGQGLGRGQGSNPEPQSEPTEWQTIEGVVLETAELVIKTRSNETVQVGLGPSQYRDAQGFVLAVGDSVQVSGYWEDDEFKAAQVENLDSGESITLRDTSGRPMWAGQGRGKNRG